MDPEAPPAAVRTRWLLVALAASTGLLAIPFLRSGGRGDAPVITPLIGQPAPPITGATAEGGRLDLGSYRGRWVLINFFATWCTACRHEQPQLDALAAEHQRGDLAIISVVHEDTVASARQYLAAHHATWPVISDDGGSIADAYLLQGLPESFVIGPDGTVAAALIGSVHRRDVDVILTAPGPATPPGVARGG